MTINVRDVSIVPEGDGVDVKRLFPLRGFMNFDPFVLWDHFTLDSGRGFPDHPHRGFEAITYMFDGGMNHKDNLGNESFVTAGGAQRFTAGSGLVHSEIPAETGISNGIQLWINLPRRLKQVDAEYQQVNANEFPVQNIEGGTVKTIVGKNSPLLSKTTIIYQHVTLNKDGIYKLNLPSSGMRGIVYVMQGSISVNSTNIHTDQAAFVEAEALVEFIATKNSEFMVCMGMPHGEPIHQHGPFVD